jgi:hypothetical protein
MGRLLLKPAPPPLDLPPANRVGRSGTLPEAVSPLFEAPLPTVPNYYPCKATLAEERSSLLSLLLSAHGWNGEALSLSGSI